MPAEFFDSNILLYLASGDDQKADLTEMLVASGGTISIQTLNEVANVLKRKLGFNWAEIRRFIQPFRNDFNVIDLTPSIHDAGLRLAERYQFAVYDGMIVAAALAAGCETLWSEDMHNGLVVDDRLTIRNPFAL